MQLLYSIYSKAHNKVGQKIGSVIAEIFLIWTNVVRTNAAWTNVTVTVGICSRWSQELTFEALSKFDQ